MPAYDYKCTKCGEVIEINCKIEELEDKEHLLKCKKCGGTLFSRKLAPFVTHFNYTRGK